MVKAILNPKAEQDDFAVKPFDLYSRPRISPTLILQRLNKDHHSSTPEGWKKYISEYAIAMTQLQRAERMLACWDDVGTLTNELRNPGHTNWNPLDHPDTLLLEVESGIMVREVQESIAEKMRDPPSAKNAVMQLNMGEGKSSVIVPIVAAALADASRIVRVVVAKPQSRQMLQMLESKLGGMLNRRVFHMPFSRALRVGLNEAIDGHLSTNGPAGLPMATQTKEVQDAVFIYISKPRLMAEEINSVEGSRLWSESTKNTVLLLRGLIALQVLGLNRRRFVP
ncbi:hypothetical protein EsH8_V_000855 [Colletotrichum jinshuiense]